MSKLKQGDRVRYNGRFLAQIGHRKDVADLRGMVLENRGPAGKRFGPDYIKLTWDGDNRVVGCMACYLERVD